ncbi:MAG: hypothetical protein KKH94_06230, partial [Candidatus Omnitrophica bacterium]|nr:hypothetical protein [Candidatus Omnitrophota bacterium]
APAEGTNFPLIIMSHGGGGTREAHAYQAEHLASHGYVVICTEHIFSNNVRVKQLMASRDKKMTFKEAIHAVTKDPRAMLGRPRDVSYAIDQAIGWNRTHRLLQRKINTKKIAVMGHSFGAYTTLVACGARPILDHMDPPVTPGKGLAEDVSDNRIAFGFAMSPQSPGTTYFGKESYKTINRPLVCLTGSKDIQKSFKGKKMSPKKRLEVFNLLPVGRKYFLWLKNADHFAFTDNPKAYLFPSEARSDTQRISKVLMVIFSDMFLKEKQDMSMPILKQYIQSLCGDVVTEIKWMEK